MTLRKRAGRPPLTGDNLTRYEVKLTPAEADFFRLYDRQTAGKKIAGSVAGGIRAAARAAT
jgi:hypothetical protein